MSDQEIAEQLKQERKRELRIARQRKYRYNNPDKIRDSVRKYRAANPEKVRESWHKSHIKNAEKRREYQRKYRAENAEKMREYNRAYLAANIDKERERVRECQRKRYAVNPDKFREASRKSATKHPETRCKYRAANPGKMREIRRAANQKRRASAKTSTADAPTTKQMADLMKDPCFYCGAKSDHADHVIPLSRGGTHDLDNLVPACAKCNFSKGAKLPAIEWNGRS